MPEDNIWDPRTGIISRKVKVYRELAQRHRALTGEARVRTCYNKAREYRDIAKLYDARAAEFEEMLRGCPALDCADLLRWLIEEHSCGFPEIGTKLGVGCECIRPYCVDVHDPQCVKHSEFCLFARSLLAAIECVKKSFKEKKNQNE